MSEIGVIGQMYEDRRTKKRGKLVERDDKYKTLLMESEEGKSFNVSFGGFKSNWRKIDEPEVTIEEAMQEVEIPEVIPEEQPKKEKKKYKERQVDSTLEDITLKLLDYAKSFDNQRINAGATPKKRSTTIRVDNKKVFEIIHVARLSVYRVCVPEKLLLFIKQKKYISEVEYHEKWINTKYSFELTEDRIDTFLEDVRQYVIDYMCEEV